MKLASTLDFAMGITRETAASLLTYELYPLGLIGQSPPYVPAIWKKQNSPKRPILFVHGIFHNKSAFAWLKQKFALQGYTHFKEVNLWTSLYSIPTLAEKISETVLQLQKKYNVKELDIIAHSMGGLVSRYYLQKLDGHKHIKNLITLGTPHNGTRLSHLSILSHFKDLSPDSPLLNDLNQLPLPEKTRCISVSGGLDIVIFPQKGARWPGARHFHLKKVGHAGLLFSKRVFQIILSHLEEGISKKPEITLKSAV